MPATRRWRREEAQLAAERALAPQSKDSIRKDECAGDRRPPKHAPIGWGWPATAVSLQVGRSALLARAQATWREADAS